jgi:hypothetical protein
MSTFNTGFSTKKTQLKTVLANVLNVSSDSSQAMKLQVKAKASQVAFAITICDWLTEIEMEFHLFNNTWEPSLQVALQPLLVELRTQATTTITYLELVGTGQQTLDINKRKQCFINLAQAGANYIDTQKGQVYNSASSNPNQVWEGEVVDNYTQTTTPATNQPKNPPKEEDSFEKIARDFFGAGSFEDAIGML